MQSDVDVLRTYLPVDRANALARGEALPSRMQGTVLFADISGFTALTETLARQFGARRGAEELTQHLNHVYDALVAEIHRHKGSVINFSGDAMTCWFNEKDEVKKRKIESSSSLRAIACGLAMQNAMQIFTQVSLPSGNPISLTMKVAVASGPVRRFVVGEPTIQLLDVMAGETLTRMAFAEHLAQPGELISDMATVSAIGGGIEVVDWRVGEMTRERFAVIGALQTAIQLDLDEPAVPKELTANQLRPWLLPIIYERLRSGQGEFLTELRQAVALFVRFEGIDYDTDEADKKLNAFIRQAQTVLTKYEGVLLALAIGDKGSYLHAAFGAPIAHEDDVRRAISAAQELQSIPPELHFIRSLQIGITRGGMRAGSYGGMTRRTYDVMGDDVNLAARLMQAAEPGEVLVSEAVRVVANKTCTWEALPPLQVKGKTQPISVYRLTGQFSFSSAPARSVMGKMVGRVAEREQLTIRLEALVNRQGGACIIEGEAGIGKSRLVADLLDRATQLDIQCLSGGGDAIEKSAPYHAWRSVFTQLFGLDTLSADPDARRTYITEAISQLPLDMQERAPLLNVLLSLGLPDNELTTQMTGEVRADNIRELLLVLLQQAAEKAPLLLVLDDAHWLDSASWALALAISQRARRIPLLFVILTRPFSEPWSDEYIHLRAQADTLWLTLEALPTADAVALVCQRLGVTTLPEQVSTLIQEKAEGNPFFSEELAYALRDLGIITIDKGECRIALDVDFTTVMVPDTVEGVIISRIDRLIPPQQLTLKVASVIGRLFAFRLLQDIHPVDTDKPQLADYLSALQNLNLTALETPDPDLTYIFKHIVTQQVAYNLMTFSQRRELHSAVGTWYEEMYPGDLPLHYPILAYHWSRTDNHSKAIEYLEKAGEQALAQYANLEVVSLLSEASRMADGIQPPVPALRRARWERQLSEAYLKLGRHAESRIHSQNALALLGRSLPVGKLKLVINLLGQILREVRRRLTSGRHRIGEAEVNLEAARACFILGELSYYDNDVILGLTLMLGIVDLLEADEPSPELVNSYAGLSVVASHIRQASLAEMYGHLAEATARYLGRIETDAFVWQVKALVQFRLGRWEDAYVPATQAAILFTRLGDRRRWEESMNYLADIAWMKGEFSNWLELLLEILASARNRNDANISLYALGDLATAHLVLGQIKDALNTIQTGFDLLPESSDPKFEMFLCARLVQAHLRQGDIGQAEQAFERGKRLAGGPSSTLVSAAASGALALASLELWEAHGQPASERVPLAEFVKQCNTKVRGDWRPIAQPLLWRLKGWEAWLSGKLARAYRMWRKSLTVAEKLKLPYEAGLSYYVLGKHSVSTNDRQSHLQKAAESFELVGAVIDLEQARQTLDLAGIPSLH